MYVCIHVCMYVCVFAHTSVTPILRRWHSARCASRATQSSLVNSRLLTGCTNEALYMCRCMCVRDRGCVCEREGVYVREKVCMGRERACVCSCECVRVYTHIFTYEWVTWLNHICGMTHSYIWTNLFIYATWLVYICDMTRSYVRHDSFICVTCLVHICDMTHSCVTWLVHICDVTHSYVWHDSFICAM